MKDKTLRLIIPQWKGGINPDYAFGAKLLSFIAPHSSEARTISFDYSTYITDDLDEDEKILYQDQQLLELDQILTVCDLEDPDKIIVFGGDCSVSQGPFDYLSGRYGKDLGIIWLDSHPDISTTEISNHNHEMVLASIMGLGDNQFSKKMIHPVDPKKVIYAGLVEDAKPKLKAFGDDFTIPVITPEEIKNKTYSIDKWIKENEIKKVCVHFDLDVLSPVGFRSLTSAKPFQTEEEYGAAIGKLNFDEVIDFLNQVNEKAEIVGLSIAEFIPWDAITLRNELEKLEIFE